MNNTNSTSDSTSKLIDNQAERAVLGSCLIDPEAIGKVASLLSEADFYREAHQLVFAAMLKLHAKRTPIDMVTLGSELESAGKLDDVEGYAGITDLFIDVPTALYAEHYANIVARKSTKRRLLSAAGKIAEIAYEDETEDKELIDKAEGILYGVGGKRTISALKPIRVSLKSTVDRIEYLSSNKGQLMGVPTGFKMLDSILGGLQKSDLIILAGRPGMGKSAWMMSVARTAITKYKANIALFSLEMSEEQLTQRLLSMSTGIDSHRLRMGYVHDDEWTMLLEASNELANTGLFIDDTPAASVTEIRTKARRLHAEHGLDMIIVDYLQLMNGLKDVKAENRNQEISHISRSLKALARELNVPVLALSQLSRAVESRADKRPMLSDLRESGSLEQDADVVLFLYRDDYYDEDSDRQNITDVMISKHRHGATGTVSLYFRKELTQFRDLEIERHEI